MSNWLKNLFSGSEKPPTSRLGRTPEAELDLQHSVPPVQSSTSPMPPGGWQPGKVLLDDFLIERTLGEGGMGRVWLVKSNSTARRFAVKQALIRDENHRKAFLTELQTWIDLPEHPNVVPCRFFRTVGDEIVIFADFIEGGSLADWIATGKFTSLEQIWDAAIQFAWGLQAIHQRGLIHQDVKPGNVLMTPGGTPMVTDFGLARARVRSADRAFVYPSLPKGQQSFLVSSGGMTPAYASPEQRAAQHLSRRTDIWSWGVSVMDIFTGGVSCLHGGHIAAEVLEELFKGELGEDEVRAMPSELKAILRRCFARDGSKRWNDFEELCSSLIDAYGRVIGRPYARTPGRSSGTTNMAVEHDRRVQHGRWRDPRTWLREAYRATGRDPADAVNYHAPEAMSRRGAEVADLAIYHEVERLLTSAIGPDDDKNANLLASFYADKALLCYAAHDSEAVFSAANKCIAIRHRLVIEQKRQKFAPDLASAYMDKAMFSKWTGDHVTALALYDKCISILEPLVKQEGRIDLAGNLARAYMNKACDLTAQGNVKTAIELFDESIMTLRSAEQCAEIEPIDDDLAHVFMNKAGALLHIGDARGAAEAYDMCIKIREPLVEREGRRELENDLADAFMGRGLALRELGDLGEAMKLFNQGIQIRERLVLSNRNSSFSRDLAHSYVNKANALLSIENLAEAQLLYGKACALYERLVVHEGQHNAANDLANVYMCMANAKRAVGDLRGAVEFHDKCIAIRERLVAKEGRTELKTDLANAYMGKGNALNDMGEHVDAMAMHDRGIAIRERMMYSQEREELADSLAEAYANKAAPAKKLGELQQAKSLYEKAIEIYQRLINCGRSDLLRRLAWVQLSRAGVILADGNMHPDEVLRTREAFELACRVAEQSNDPECIYLVEWAKQSLGEVLYDRSTHTSLEFCLPSGLRGRISYSAVIMNFSNIKKWLRCPRGHLWIATPNISISSPPYRPEDQIVVEEISAPAPKSRKEAMEFVHVYIGGEDHTLYWRGDWMDSFHESYPLDQKDRKAWTEWVSTTGEFLDDLIRSATNEAARAADLGEYLEPVPFVRYSLVSASGIPKQTTHEAADQLYKLSELMGRSYKLTSGMRQMDYETAVDATARWLVDQGYQIVSADSHRGASCSLIAKSAKGTVDIKVTTTRPPNDPGYGEDDVRTLWAYCTGKTNRCAIAPVGLMPGTKRSADGHPEFYVKYNGLVSV